jgi:hypothetical protein
MPIIPPAVVIRPPFLVRGPDGGFRFAVRVSGLFDRPPLVCPVLSGPLVPTTVIPAVVIGIVKTAFIIEDNIVRGAVFRFCHRLQLLT